MGTEERGDGKERGRTKEGMMEEREGGRKGE